MGLITNIWTKVTNKNYWISNLVIIFGILLLQNTVEKYIIQYISLQGILLNITSLIIIVVVLRLASEEILEI